MAEMIPPRAQHGPSNGGGNNKSSIDRCRERRRRRIRMRRESVLAAVAANGDVLPWRRSIASTPTKSNFLEEEVRRATNDVPVVGAVALAGKQSHMEDAISIKTSLCSPAINHRRPLHFFGVFDGHGGPHFAIMCKQNMHAILEEELMSLENNNNVGSILMDENVLHEAWRRVFSSCFSRTESVALHTCGCGSVDFRCTCFDRSVVIQSGSTAVAVVLTLDHIVVANCGDSRAVLCSGGRVVPLSIDHKPDREDERVRIEAIGGCILNLDIERVEGVLAMTRAIGDKFLKPYVISEPEVTFKRRDSKDEFLILASDGLWDVVSNEMACQVVHDCLNEPRYATSSGGSQDINAEGEGPRLHSRSASAAALLARLALARNSYDNIGVVVVDLKRIV